MVNRQIQPVRAALKGVFQAPPSKSATHRALVTAALAEGRSLLINPLDSMDTRVTLAGLEAIGVPCGAGRSGWWVDGIPAGMLPGGGTINLGESGTSMRFLAALAGLCHRPVAFTGVGRLPSRPMEELLQVLEAGGAVIQRAADGSALPLAIGSGPNSARGGSLRIQSGRSSQFASALLLTGSRLEGGLDLSLSTDAVSVPYVAMTAAILSRFGVGVVQDGPLRWRVPQGSYSGRTWTVEGDWSSASYLLASAAVAGGSVRVRGLEPGSHQPDAALLPVLIRCGHRVTVEEDEVTVDGQGPTAGFEEDVSSCPDLAPTLAILGLFSREHCEIRSAGILRYKESDRLQLLAENLGRLGRPVEIRGDDLVLPECHGARLEGAEIRTDADHRIAMAFAVAGLVLPGMAIRDAQCVCKSNPGFWAQLERLETGAA